MEGEVEENEDCLGEEEVVLMMMVVRANTNMSRMCLREESWKPVVNCEVPGLKVFGMCVCFHLVYVIIKRNLSLNN